ncbi:MAG: ABC transporter ATP-binding protein [Burkholderiales bacterium]|nr:ABC transporter ATP-binding protein [Anaerolineae bacterium]
MTYLRMEGISKRYADVTANDHVDFAVERGEIHALVGENGAGKSTLMKILYGMETPDEGQVFLQDRAVSITNPQAAIRLGIGMVHQHFQLVPSLTVAENVALGYEPHNGLFVDRKRMIERVRDLSERFGLSVDPLARVADLSVGIQQRIEILKLLYRDAQLLILDEPSAVLTPQEVDDLFDVLRRLVAEGRTAIFITHKMREIMDICQRVTVLRRGKIVGTTRVVDTNPADIAQMMVGRDVDTLQGTRRSPVTATGETRLIVRDLNADDDRGLPALRGISFSVHSGEIVGLAGVEGNGQRELLEVLVGLLQPTQGDIVLNGQSITHLRSRQRRERGLAVIPEDRQHEGLSQPLSILENLMSTRYYAPPLSRLGFLLPRPMQQLAAQLMQQYDIRASSIALRVGALSGGNAQKVVVARELSDNPAILIGSQPTRGLDVAAARFVHDQLLRLRDAGAGILMISADLDELLTISDRLLVIFGGRIVGELNSAATTREQIGLLMAGRTETAVQEVQN